MASHDLVGAFEKPLSVCLVCGDSSVYEILRAMLDPEPPSISKAGGITGRINEVNVVLKCLTRVPEDPDFTKHLKLIIGDIRYVIFVNIGPNYGPTHNVGDVVITKQTRDASTSFSRALDTLRATVSEDGRWLRHNLVEECATSPELTSLIGKFNRDMFFGETLHHGSVPFSSADGETLGTVDRTETVDLAAAIMILNQDIPPGQPEVQAVMIHGISERASSGQSGSGQWREYAAANAVSYVRQIVVGMGYEGLGSSKTDVEAKGSVIPSLGVPILPGFGRHRYRSYGNDVLLVIPTANKGKVKLLKEAFGNQSPTGAKVHSVVIPFESGVGEQPYNKAGVLGAHNRISNALCHFDKPQNQDVFKKLTIGTVMVAAIESYFQLDNARKPIDYGLVEIHNATTGETRACQSQGVIVSWEAVKRAQSFGFGADRNHGMVTVGKVLAANTNPLLDHANWHERIAGKSRYTLIAEALQSLEIPW